MKVLITTVLLAVLIYNSRNESIMELIYNVNIVYFILACSSFILGIMLNTIRLQYLFNREYSTISFGKLLKINFIGLFFSIFLPGRTVGDFIRGYYLSKFIKPLDVTVSNLLIWRLIGIFAMIFIACNASIISYPILGEFSLIYYSIGTLIIFMAALFILLNHAFLKRIYQYSLMQKFVHKELARTLEKILKSLNMFRNYKQLISKNILLSLISNSFILLTWFLLSCSINAKISIIYFFIFIPLVSLLQAIPISFNGIGVREGTTVLFFSSVGISIKMPLTIAMLFSTLSILVSLFGGIIYLFYKSEVPQTIQAKSY